MEYWQILRWARSKLLLLVFIVISGGSFAQVTVSGIVTNGVESVPGAITSLLRADTTVVTALAVGPDGKYVFADVNSGNYLLRTSMVGYETLVSATFVVGDSDVALPEIVLQELITTLAAVEVQGDRIVFDQQSDRLVLNVASSVTSAGSTVLDVLQKSPGVVVNRQSSNIAINGRAGVRIMIDDKMMQIPTDAAMQMLDGMNAGSIETIELITNPASRYDADGSGGIIHIRTKESSLQGTSVLAGLTAGARWAENIGATINASHRSKRLNVAFDYAYLRNHNLHTFDLGRSTFVRGLSQSLTAHSRRENVTTQQNLSLGTEWTPSKKTAVNFLFTAYERNWKLDANSQELYLMEADSLIMTKTLTHESNVWRSVTGSAGITQRFNDAHSLSLGVDALFYRNDNPSRYKVVSSDDDYPNDNNIELSKDTPIRVFVAHGDYTVTRSKTWRWDVGAKTSFTRLNNDVSTMRNADGTWRADSAFTSYSDLEEDIAAAYISGQWNPNEKWQFNAGIRYEFTQTHIAIPSNTNLVDRKYGNFFPNVSFRNTMNSDHDIQMSYSRRITRPTYNDIAPYVFFWASNTFSSGNTALYPAISDQFSIAYRIRQWNISLQGTRASNAIAYLQPERVGQSAALIYRSVNTDYSNTLAAVVGSTAISIAPWWQLTCALTFQYQRVRTSHLEYNLVLEKPGVNANLVSQVRLPNGFSFEISGMYQSATLSGVVCYRALGSLNAGVQKTFRKNGTLRLAMDDILATNVWELAVASQENRFSSTFHYDWYNQYIRLTYSFTLGARALKAVKVKGGADEERGRVTD